jgi:hypothetical protein
MLEIYSYLRLILLKKKLPKSLKSFINVFSNKKHHKMPGWNLSIKEVATDRRKNGELLND